MTTKSSAHCPVCAQESQHAYAPFCSAKCQNLDLLRWMNGHYRIPTETEAPDSLPSEDASDPDDL